MYIVLLKNVKNEIQKGFITRQEMEKYSISLGLMTHMKTNKSEIILDTNQLSIEECTRKIMSYLFDTVKITE